MPELLESEMPATEASVAARVSRERLIRMIQVGRLRGRRAPSGWVVDRSSIAEFVAEHSATRPTAA